MAARQRADYDGRVMNGPDHYREAERLLQEAASGDQPGSGAVWCLELAKLHTALAQVTDQVADPDRRALVSSALRHRGTRTVSVAASSW